MGGKVLVALAIICAIIALLYLKAHNWEMPEWHNECDPNVIGGCK